MSGKFTQGAVSDYGQDEISLTNDFSIAANGALGEAFGNLGAYQGANSAHSVDQSGAGWHSNAAVLKPSPFAAKITGPVKFMGIIQRKWGLDDADAAKLFGLGSPTTYKLIVSGQRTLPASPDIRERFGLITQIHSRLKAYLRTDAAELSWIIQFRIGGATTPLELIQDGRFAGLYRINTAVSECFGE